MNDLGIYRIEYFKKSSTAKIYSSVMLDRDERAQRRKKKKNFRGLFKNIECVAVLPANELARILNKEYDSKKGHLVETVRDMTNRLGKHIGRNGYEDGITLDQKIPILTLYEGDVEPILDYLKYKKIL